MTDPQQGINRREFVKAGTAVALGMHLAPGSLLAGDEGKADDPRRILRSGRYYRRLGRTGLMVSEISLGGSPVPPEPVFRKAIEMGVNYVDTSSSYMEGNSERLIGKLVKGRRDRFHVTTKFHTGRRRMKTEEEILEEVTGSLKRLDTDYIDVLMVHGAPSAEVLKNEAVLAVFEKLKKEGRIRFTGVSCHQDPVGVLTPAIQSGHYDIVTLGYNAYSGDRVEKEGVYADYLERSGIEKVIALAKKHDVGVVAMKSMAGGDRQDLAKFQVEGVTLPQAKLRWVLDNDAVGAVITEMETFEVLEENLAVSGVKASSEEKEALKEYVRATGRDYCRMCGTCMTACPEEVAIPDILRYAAYHRGYGKPVRARAAYLRLSVHQSAKGCARCGRCENVCPHGLPIMGKLEDAHRLLA